MILRPLEFPFTNSTPVGLCLPCTRGEGKRRKTTWHQGTAGVSTGSGRRRRFRVTYREDFPDGDPSLTEPRADLTRKDGPPIPGSLHERGSSWEAVKRVYEQIGDVPRKGSPSPARALQRPGRSSTVRRRPL